jgi:hypothetical protein
MKAGIYDNIDIRDYHADKSWFSASAIKRAKKSLTDFMYYQSGFYDNQNKSFLDFGNAFELALLDPDGFDKMVANEADVFAEISEKHPDIKKFRATKIYEDWFNSHKKEGRYILPQTGSESFETIRLMLNSCYKDAAIQKLIKNVEYQKSIYWVDEATKLQLKTRPDFCKLKTNVVVDLKTARDASPEAFSKDIVNFDYPMQAIMQIDGVIESGLMPNVDFYYWLVVEKEPPYNAQIYEFSLEDRNWIYEEYRLILQKIKKAMESNFYPGYTDRADNKFGILKARIPLWYSQYKVIE